jgi:hypothetical protein
MTPCPACKTPLPLPHAKGYLGSSGICQCGTEWEALRRGGVWVVKVTGHVRDDADRPALRLIQGGAT